MRHLRCDGIERWTWSQEDSRHLIAVWPWANRFVDRAGLCRDGLDSARKRVKMCVLRVPWANFIVPSQETSLLASVHQHALSAHPLDHPSIYPSVHSLFTPSSLAPALPDVLGCYSFSPYIMLHLLFYCCITSVNFFGWYPVSCTSYPFSKWL